MFKKILLPLDLTDKHQPALEIAANVAHRPEGELILLHVIEVIPGLPMEEEKSFYNRLERAAQEHLDRLGLFCEERRVPWRAVIRYGARAHEVARFAREIEADLIVVTAPQLDPSHPAAGWGSLSWKIGVLGPCPILLVK